MVGIHWQVFNVLKDMKGLHLVLALRIEAGQQSDEEDEGKEEEL
jgi:hypothetical protein